MKNTKLLSRVVVTIIAILLLTLICGCSDADSDNLKGTEEILDVNLNYSIVNENGNHYFVFNDPDLYAPLTVPDGLNISVMAPVAKFDSIGELVSRVKKGTLTEEQKRAIAQFDKDEEGRIKVCNFGDMYQPKLPRGCSISEISWYGDHYTFTLDIPIAKIGYVEVLTKDIYDKEFQYNYSDTLNSDNITVVSTEKDGAGKTTTYYTTSSGNFKEVKYNYTNGGKEVFVVEKYWLEVVGSVASLVTDDIPISSSIPMEVQIYGTESDRHYNVSLFCFSEEPTADWMFSFDITKYVETEKS